MPYSTASAFDTFPSFLASTLRVGTKLRVYHVSTPPTICDPIFAVAPGATEEITTCESHFLTVSQRTTEHELKSNVNDLNGGQIGDDVLVLGIEILIFDTKTATTVFVSKADSTGLPARSRVSGHASDSIIKGVISAFIEWLVSRSLLARTSEVPEGSTDKPQNQETTGNIQTAPASLSQPEDISHTSQYSKKVILSLFARSQNQYLFPGSVENTSKHVLDDRQLIKWWCRVLDPLLQKNWVSRIHSVTQPSFNDIGTSAHARHNQVASTSANSDDATTITPQAYVIVPGCDRAEVHRSFIPKVAEFASSARAVSKWQSSFPSQYIVHQDLKQSGPQSLPIRCLIPRFPDDPKARFCHDLDDAGTDDKGQWKTVKSVSQFWEMMEYRQECAAGRVVGFLWLIFDPIKNQNAQTRQSSDKPHAPPKALSIDQEGQNACIKNTDLNLHPTPPASISLNSEQYTKLSDFLINDTDFAGLKCAIESTSQWISKVKELAGIMAFGVEVAGRSAIMPAIMVNGEKQTGLASSSANNSADLSMPGSQTVNILTGMKRKKRGADVINEVKSFPASTGLDRISEPAIDASTQEPHDVINVLGTSLVRKKPKIQ